MRKRILHVIGSLSKGGAEHQLQLLLRSLDSDQFELSVMYLYEGPNVNLPEHIERIAVDRGGKYNLIRLWRSIAREIRAREFDLIHVWLPEVVALPAALSGRMARVPVITSQRTTMSCKGAWRKRYRNVFRYLQIMAANCVISNFEVDEEPALFRYLFRRKGGVAIANGLDVEGLRGLPPREFPERAEWRLVYSGRLSPEKRIEIAFQAVKALLGHGKDVHLTLFGEGDPSYVRELAGVVEELGIQRNITFYGQCEGWVAYASDAHALLFPSRGEGTSNVVLEALAIGLPVVISDIAMARRLFQHEISAFIVSSKDADAWTDAIRTVLEQPQLRARLSVNGKKVAGEFRTEVMVRSYASVYSRMRARV